MNPFPEIQRHFMQRESGKMSAWGCNMVPGDGPGSCFSLYCHVINVGNRCATLDFGTLNKV
jgi:hypothetical protein